MAALKVGEGIAALKVTELGDYLREQRTSAQLSLRQLAAVAGVSNPYLSQVERGLRKPSAEVLQQIAKGLRISAEALYVRAGILDERDDRVEVEAAVLADPHLTERQRQVLLDIYATFRSKDDAGGPPATMTSARGASQPRKRTTTKSLAEAAATGSGTSRTRDAAQSSKGRTTKGPNAKGPKAKGPKVKAAGAKAPAAGTRKSSRATTGTTSTEGSGTVRESNVIADSTAATAIAAITTPAPDAESLSAGTGTTHTDQGE